ncbi:hypothetical protein GCM10011391_13400 [Pullulanibacillus camelliae]|uniref:DJ-1/PfpI domain-containing protein n=1 Tax=Pullulanibacillus camelliae TaxID=1707096 RepID=A0A8J2VNL6_9BACL|nr:hypothetical protein [Pullulanibacillus camelliae]GGE35932.1 hypothetical protein GCM10011391_13400 [Pullulanibacillus camelliae]
MDVLGVTGTIPMTARVEDEGNLITSEGITTGLDIALYVVERELGPRIAHEVEKLFEYERRGTIWCEKGLVPIDADSHPNSDTRSIDEAPFDKTSKERVPVGSALFDGT